MNQKNHSQRNVHLQDLKNTTSSEIYTVSNKSNSLIWSVLIIAAILFVAASIYNKNNNSGNEQTRSTNQIDESIYGTLSQTQPSQQPLDLDEIESLSLDQERKPVAVIEQSLVIDEESSQDKPTPPEDDSLVVDANRLNPEPQLRWISVEIEKGDSLSKIFERLDLPHKDAIAIASDEQMKTLNYLIVGQKLEIKISSEGEFSGIKYRVNKLKTLEIDKTESGELVSKIEELEPLVRIRDVTAPIDNSLSNTALTLQIPNRVISKLSSIFRWDIDFARDIKEGDRFSLIFEEKFLGDELIETGDILAAEFIINGNITRAIRHQDANGNSQYYTPEGKSLRKAFMRNPIKFARVTSGFTKRRYHPVLKKWRAHKGVDYGAHKGTPIMATADGIINHIGRKGAYGKAVVINHGKDYSTLYGHMSGFRKGLKNGTRVTQGQIIGYVGSTGLATGPHLHYEFRIAGKHVDPLAIDLPRSLPIDSQELNEFIAASEKWIERLDALQGEPVASLSPSRQPSI